MNTNLKKAKEKLINSGFRLDGEEEVIIDDTTKYRKEAHKQ